MQAHQDIQVTYWGDTVDYNLYTKPSDLRKDQEKGIEHHSITIAPSFIDPHTVDFNLRTTHSSTFKPFDMQHFGVLSDRLKQLAEKPKIPRLITQNISNINQTFKWKGSVFKNIETLGGQSAAGLPTMVGVLTVNVPNSSLLFKKLLKGDVIVTCHRQSVDNFQEFAKILKQDQYKSLLRLIIYRNQSSKKWLLNNNIFSVHKLSLFYCMLISPYLNPHIQA